ncbi:hypothetical protein ABFX02_03G101000 [Erythranthe guttata]
MDSGSIQFGKGPRELTGALDLISHYKLLPHHEFFCKKSSPVSVLDTHYLYNVVGDTDIRKGEGMQLDQLIQNAHSRDTLSRIQPFNLNVLGEAFRLQESSSVDLPPSEKGIPTVAVKAKSESKTKDKQRKHKDKDKDTKKHKHRSKEEKEKRKAEKKKRRDRDGGEEEANAVKKHKKK